GNAVRNLFDSLYQPTAIFAASDFLALTVLKVARSLVLRVPSDVSLVVFDDNSLVQQAEPPLTAVSQPNSRIGEEAMGLLLDRIANPEIPLVQRLIVPSMVLRSSTGPIRMDPPLARAQ
ncbi:MAG: substrate-binding domain-containing protein, partial [Chloroflexota bacterium]